MSSIYIYDSTARDEASRVRGIGRYFQTILENFPGSKPSLGASTSPSGLNELAISYVSDHRSIPKDAVFINPFFNILSKPLKLGRVTKKQIAVIHDLIPLKYPHEFPLGLKAKLFKFINRLLIKNFELIITDSEASKRDICEILKIPANKVRVIYPTVLSIFLPHLDASNESVEHHHPFHLEAGQEIAEFSKLDLSRLSTNEKLKGLTNYILYVGDATWNKNLPNLAHAVKMANVTCVCVGSTFSTYMEKSKTSKPHPWQKSLFQFLDLTRDDMRFIFPGFISDIELMLLYKNAKLNLLPSYDEGFGYSIVESGYMSAPSILSDIPVFHEIAKEAAIFANPNEPREIAQKIVELYYDNVKHEKTGIKAFDRAEDFTPLKFKNDWTKAIKSII